MLRLGIISRFGGRALGSVTARCCPGLVTRRRATVGPAGTGAQSIHLQVALVILGYIETNIPQYAIE